MRSSPLDDIIREFHSFIDKKRIKAHFLKLQKLIEDGVLSVTPLLPPPRPLFYRLVLLVAAGCNMGCRYCFEKDVPAYRQSTLLTREMADRILCWFFDHQKGPKAHIQIYGGEPLLNWPIVQYVVDRCDDWSKCQSVVLSKYMITNGTLLDADKIKWLKERSVAIQVSVDGDKETHDRFRVYKSGVPTMGHIQPNIAELIRQKGAFNLRAVLTREQTDPELILTGLRKHGATRVSFEVVATDCQEARLAEKDWSQFNKKYLRLLHRPFSSWIELPEDLQNIIIRICEQRRIIYGCGAGLSEVTITPDGAIYECQRLFRPPLGHVGDNKGLPELESHFLTPVDDREHCRSCWARYLCGGGCLHQSHIGHASDAPLPQFCEMKRNLAEAAIIKSHEIKMSNAGHHAQNQEDRIEQCTIE